MNPPPFSRKSIILAAVISFAISTYVFTSFISRDTHFVFCDVGQGDAFYARVDNQIDMLVDGGPDTKVLSCLGRHMPFFDRTIEYLFVTHPDNDHIGGLLEVLNRYTVKTIVMNPIPDSSDTNRQLLKRIKEKHISVVSKYQDSKILFGSAKIQVLWPPRRLFTTGSTLPTNDYSLVFLFSSHNKHLLLTGDIPEYILEPILREYAPHLDIFKLPHHGSKSGINRALLGLAEHALAVISVGAKNRYHHPAETVIDLLEAMNIKYLRTDKKGDIVFTLAPTGKFLLSE
ncbi:MBL fold metallo-hydrolase [Candidatus Roizmanbacteria bacterium]|nr:MBL fold metallo-hydrolase [Candidatus Roizmanbacteria bacterium]